MATLGVDVKVGEQGAAASTAVVDGVIFRTSALIQRVSQERLKTAVSELDQ